MFSTFWHVYCKHTTFNPRNYPFYPHWIRMQRFQPVIGVAICDKMTSATVEYWYSFIRVEGVNYEDSIQTNTLARPCCCTELISLASPNRHYFLLNTRINLFICYCSRTVIFCCTLFGILATLIKPSHLFNI